MPMVTDADWPGFRVTAREENDVVQPEGCVDVRLNVLGAHADESLLVMLTE